MQNELCKNGIFEILPMFIILSAGYIRRLVIFVFSVIYIFGHLVCVKKIELRCCKSNR